MTNQNKEIKKTNKKVVNIADSLTRIESELAKLKTLNEDKQIEVVSSDFEKATRASKRLEESVKLNTESLNKRMDSLKEDSTFTKYGVVGAIGVGVLSLFIL